LEKEITCAHWPTESPPTPDVLEQPMKKLEGENFHALGIDLLFVAICCFIHYIYACMYYVLRPFINANYSASIYMVKILLDCVQENATEL
jgi:hypothetical protein